jgi:hypothetical protein
MTIILCAINADTGELLALDGSVRGKVVPMIPGEAIRDAMHKCEEEPFQTVRDAWSLMLAASRVDLSGCAVKVPELLHVPAGVYRAGMPMIPNHG